MSEPETGWVSALIKCDLCGHESLSVHHVSCDKLECGNCGHMSHYEVIELYTVNIFFAIEELIPLDELRNL